MKIQLEKPVVNNFKVQGGKNEKPRQKVLREKTSFGFIFYLQETLSGKQNY